MVTELGRDGRLQKLNSHTLYELMHLALRVVVVIRRPLNFITALCYPHQNWIKHHHTTGSLDEDDNIIRNASPLNKFWFVDAFVARTEHPL